MKVNRKDFLEILEKAMLAVLKKEHTALGCFVFEDDFIYSYNTEMMIAHKLPFEFENKFMVKADDLHKLLKKIPDEKIELLLKEKALQIKTKNLTANIQIITEGSFYKEIMKAHTKEEKWTNAPTNLYTGFEMCYMPDNNSYYVGICAKEDRMMSMDGRLCGIYQLESEIGDFWIDNNAIKTILKIFPGKIDYVKYIDNSWICFKKDNLIFSCRKIEDKKFNFEKFEGLFTKYAKKDTDISSVFPDEFADVIDRASLFAFNNKVISIEFLPGKITCKSDDKKNNFTETIQWKEKIETNILFRSDYSFFVYALKRTSHFYLKEKPEYGKNEGEHIVFFTPGYNYKLIMKSLGD